MKKIFLLMLCSLLSALIIDLYGFCENKDRAESFPFMAKVNAKDVNIRSGPNLNFEIIGKVNFNQILAVFGKKDSWYKIKIPYEFDVFINSKLVQIKSDSIGIITTNRVNVRSKPNLKSTVLSQMNKGDIVSVRGEKDEWLTIGPPRNCYAWINEKFVDYFKPYYEDEQYLSIEKQRPQAEKKENRLTSKPKEISPLVEGIVEDSGRLINRNSLHKLLDEKGNLLYYLDSDKKILDAVSNLKVAIWGEVSKRKGYNAPIIKVGKIVIKE
ncbi:MAG: SH3 domain-containing protein [Candidatus Omnitrophota bacterium]